MAYAISRVDVWTRAIDDRAGSLAATLEPLADAGIDVGSTDIRELTHESLSKLLSGEDGDDLWSVVYLAERLADTIRGAVAALEPAVVAKWAFQLAQRFNIFYHNHHILS